MRILAWNVYIDNDPQSVGQTVAGWLEQYKPEVVVLNEATRCWKVLSRAARGNGYRHYQGVTGQAAGIAVLVRSDVAVVRRREAVMRRWWRGPIHGWRQKPRRYPYLRLRLPGGRVVRLMALHFPTGGANAPAVAESLDRTRVWLRRGLSRVPAVTVGDTNLGVVTLRTKLAGRVGRGAVVVPGHHVDNLIGRGVTGRSTTLGKHGSDHEAVLYTLTIGG
jgi:exonuclease III